MFHRRHLAWMWLYKCSVQRWADICPYKSYRKVLNLYSISSKDCFVYRMMMLSFWRVRPDYKEGISFDQGGPQGPEIMSSIASVVFAL